MTAHDHAADAAAMLRLRAGDDLALNELMARWQEPLRRFLLRYTGNEADALDIAQDTFVRVYEARARYDTRGKFSTWLHTIAGNLARNLARYKARHPAAPLDAGLSPDNDMALGERYPDSGATPTASTEEKELAIAVRTAIAGLPDDQRMATILFEYEDQSHADIATVLGCSAKAVENKLYRARLALREILAGWFK